jgi:hypothetical protein
VCLNTQTLGSNDKHTNHYTTEVTNFLGCQMGWDWSHITNDQ